MYSFIKGERIWYHYDCLGMSLSDGLKFGASGDGFVCPHCLDTTLDVPGAAVDNSTADRQDLPSTPNAPFVPYG